MTEQEQKAIEELLLEIVEIYEEYYKDTYEALILTEISRDYKNSKIILNLISKLQADIDLKDKVIEKAFRYVKKKQSQQYKYALSKIECEELIKILKK